MKELDDLNNLCVELNKTNSINSKKTILAKYPQCRKLLRYVYSPFVIFGVTSYSVKKYNKNLFQTPEYRDTFDLLDDLSTRTVTGDAALQSINDFINSNKQYEQLILNIIDKNLKVRIDSSIINSVWPGLIPEFKVALAKEVGKDQIFDNSWLISRKCDGVRCIAIKTGENKIELCSRSGIKFETLGEIEKELINLPGGTILDGEICLVDKDDNEDFQHIMKEIHKKDHTIKNPKYLVFDILNINEFYFGNRQRTLSVRLKELEEVVSKFKKVEMLSQLPYSESNMILMQENVAKFGWEGLMLRKDTFYEGKRTKNLLKMKSFHDAEYTVKSIVNGPIRFIQDGKEIEEEMLSKVIIIHKDNEVGVGSGFSIDQRREFYKHPKKIIGKLITVKYFSESQNQDGKYSLRFPTIKAIHGDKREI